MKLLGQLLSSVCVLIFCSLVQAQALYPKVVGLKMSGSVCDPKNPISYNQDTINIAVFQNNYMVKKVGQTSAVGSCEVQLQLAVPAGMKLSIHNLIQNYEYHLAKDSSVELSMTASFGKGESASGSKSESNALAQPIVRVGPLGVDFKYESACVDKETVVTMVQLDKLSASGLAETPVGVGFADLYLQAELINCR